MNPPPKNLSQRKRTPATALVQILMMSLILVSTLILDGCATAPKPFASSTVSTTPRAFPPSDGGPNIASRLTPEDASHVTIDAISLVGTPYLYGGNTPDTGFDCSGLIAYVYKSRAGLLAPRTVASLVSWGQPVGTESVRAGDLVVFTQNGRSTHAGIYVGEGRFVHAPSTGGDVRLDRLTSSYWSRQPTSFRRP